MLESVLSFFIAINKTHFINKKTKRFNSSSIIVDVKWLNTDASGWILVQEPKGESCADLESFVRGGPNLITFFFFVLFLVEDTAIHGPSSAASETPLQWCFACGPIMAQHWMLARLLCDFSGGQDQKETLYFCDVSRGGGPDPQSPSGSAQGE